MFLRVISFFSVFFLIGFSAGYLKGCSDAETQAQADKAESLTRLINHQLELDAENNEITQAWLEDEVKRRAITKTVEIEVIKYVPKIQKVASACNITVGTECLLNARRLNRMPIDECGPLTAEEKRAASPVTEAGLIWGDIECADKYASLSLRHDSLIDVFKNYEKRLVTMRRGDGG